MDRGVDAFGAQSLRARRVEAGDDLYRPAGTLGGSPGGPGDQQATKTIYWSNLQSGLIRYAGLDGSNPGTLPLPANASPYALAVDGANQQLYWTSYLDNRIYRTDLATHTSELVLTEIAGGPGMFGLAYYSPQRKLYWTSSDGPSVRSANANGTNIQTVVSGEAGTYFRDIEITPFSHQLVWVQDGYDLHGVSTIRYADLDGSNLGTLGEVSSQASGVAVYLPEPASLGMLMAGGSVLSVVRRWGRRGGERHC